MDLGEVNVTDTLDLILRCGLGAVDVFHAPFRVVSLRWLAYYRLHGLIVKE